MLKQSKCSDLTSLFQAEESQTVETWQKPSGPWVCLVDVKSLTYLLVHVTASLAWCLAVCWCSPSNHHLYPARRRWQHDQSCIPAYRINRIAWSRNLPQGRRQLSMIGTASTPHMYKHIQAAVNCSCELLALCVLLFNLYVERNVFKLVTALQLRQLYHTCAPNDFTANLQACSCCSCLRCKMLFSCSLKASAAVFLPIFGHILFSTMSKFCTTFCV